MRQQRCPLKSTFLVALLALTLVPCDALARVTQREQGLPEARRLWEQAVAAKGGRERLHSVTNLVVTWRQRGRAEDEFYVFPDRLWERRDLRAINLGLMLRTCNFAQDVCWDIYNRKETAVKRAGRAMPYPGQAMSMTQIFYFMETRWVQPELVGARTKWVGLRQFDVVETVVNDRRVDFFLDRRTHLPARMEYFRVFEQTEEVSRGAEWLDDYTNVNGIMMAQQVRKGSTGNRRLTYQIDVNYNERLFDHPPTTDMGPEAWRAASAQPR